MFFSQASPVREICIRIKAQHCCAIVAQANTEIGELVATINVRQAITYGLAGSMQTNLLPD